MLFDNMHGVVTSVSSKVKLIQYPFLLVHQIFNCAHETGRCREQVLGPRPIALAMFSISCVTFVRFDLEHRFRPLIHLVSLCLFPVEPAIVPHLMCSCEHILSRQ